MNKRFLGEKDEQVVDNFDGLRISKLICQMKKSLLFILIISLFSSISCKSIKGEKDKEDNYKIFYFVDGKVGSDSNPGTMTAPLKTIKEINARLLKKPADIYFAGGQVFDGTLLLSDIKGKDAHPIRINSYGKSRAIINGGNAESIIIKNCRNIWVSDLDIKGNGRNGGNKTNGLSISQSENCIVEKLNAVGFQKSGVDLYNCSVIVVKKVNASENGFCGINVMGSTRDLSGKIRIQDCKAENNPGDPSNLTNHSGNGILVGISNGVTVDHCIATNNGWDMPREGNGPVGIWTWESSHVIIQYCISYSNKTAKNAKDGGGYDLDGGVTNSLIQYCLSYENQGAGYGLFQYSGASPWARNTVRYCVSINDAQTTDGSGSFFIWNGSNDVKQLTGCMIYNNVVYNTKAPIISFESSSVHKDFVFCNNIFIGADQAIAGVNSGSKFLGNDWWSNKSRFMFTTYGNLNIWAKETGQEMMNDRQVGMQIDPKFKGPMLTDITDPYQLDKLYGFTLEPDSPLKNKGIDIKSLFHITEPLRDFYGSPVPLGLASEPGIFEMK